MNTLETFTPNPNASKVKLEKRSAIQTVADVIFSRAPEKATLTLLLQVAGEYLQEVRGSDYRLEQAAAKFMEYLQFEVDVENERNERREELNLFVPGIVDRLHAVNDLKFNNTENNPEVVAKKYIVG